MSIVVSKLENRLIQTSDCGLASHIASMQVHTGVGWGVQRAIRLRRSQACRCRLKAGLEERLITLEEHARLYLDLLV